MQDPEWLCTDAERSCGSAWDCAGLKASAAAGELRAGDRAGHGSVPTSPGTAKLRL